MKSNDGDPVHGEAPQQRGKGEREGWWRVRRRWKRRSGEERKKEKRNNM